MKNLESIFLNEKVMRNVAVLSVAFGLCSFIVMAMNNDLTLLSGFERAVKLLLTIVTLWSFSKIQWDVTKGLMGGLLFALLYQESFLVLGTLWGGITDFDSYLIMGVQGSLFLAAESMSFMMTFIIIVNHFVIGYSNKGNLRNVIFNQMSIVFKILLYILLLIVNTFLEMPMYQQVCAGLEYVADLGIVIMLICVETQFDNYNSMRHELLLEKRNKGVNHE